VGDSPLIALLYGLLQDDGVDQPQRGATGTVTGAKGARQTSLDRGPPAWVGSEALPGAVDEVAGAGGVVLVAAEPGAGKTTLLRRWLAAREPGAQRPTVARGDRPDEVAQALRHLRFGDGGVVVVDDATALGDDGLVGLGARLAGRAAAVGVVLSGRAELGLCTTELRERGPFLELDGTDLAWDAKAVRAALEGWGWEDVTAEEATAVAARTDGWPAAVRLVAAAGRDQPWEAHLIDAVRGLVSEAELDDLLRLSLADTLDDGAVAALLGDGEGRLAELWRRRLFVRPGAQSGTLRFVTPVHHALRRELAARPPSLGAAARRGAARHAAASAAAAPLGAPADAGMGAALLGDDLLAAQTLELMLAGRLVAPAPAALGAAAAASPLGRAAASLALLDAGDVDLARATLPGAGAALDVGPVLAQVHALLAARRDEDLAATAAYAARLACASRAHAGLEALAWLQLGTLEHDLGWNAPADEHLRLAASLADRAGAFSLLAQARAVRATLAAMNGHLREAERLARSVPLVEPRAETRMRRAVALAHVAFLRDDLALAQEHLAAARAAATRTRDPHVWSALLFLDLLVLDARGEDDRAFERLAEATAARARCARRPRLDRALVLYRVRLLDRAGRDAEADAERARLCAEDDPLVGLAFARRALERGDATEASRALSSWSANVPADAAWGLRVSHLAARALAADRLGDRAAAHATLEEALELTAPERLVRPFLEDGIRLRDLLGRHRAAGTAHAAFAGELIDRLTGARPVPDARLLHPLTEREVAVLGYLPTPLTAAEIAAELFVAEATVRTHMRHIYDKLGVAGRREAVERGRDLGVRARVSW
jgi:LuxR family maltose regulon positive regulatory protein